MINHSTFFSLQSRMSTLSNPNPAYMHFLAQILGVYACDSCCNLEGARSAHWLSRYIAKNYSRCNNSDEATIEQYLEYGYRTGLFRRGFDEELQKYVYAFNRLCLSKDPQNARFLGPEYAGKPVPYGTVEVKCCPPPDPCSTCCQPMSSSSM